MDIIEIKKLKERLLSIGLVGFENANLYTLPDSVDEDDVFFVNFADRPYDWMGIMKRDYYPIFNVLSLRLL